MGLGFEFPGRDTTNISMKLGLGINSSLVKFFHKQGAPIACKLFVYRPALSLHNQARRMLSSQEADIMMKVFKDLV